ncbi:hypothetical protein CBL_13727 [Carabus blaptoides fortunei]
MQRRCIIISYSVNEDNPIAAKDSSNQAISIGKWRARFNHDNIATAVYYSTGFTGVCPCLFRVFELADLKKHKRTHVCLQSTWGLLDPHGFSITPKTQLNRPKKAWYNQNNPPFQSVVGRPDAALSDAVDAAIRLVASTRHSDVATELRNLGALL